jgi:hypothetical protein
VRLFGVLLLTACSPSPPDVVPTSREVRIVPDAGEDTYAYVARRPHGAVALAEAREMDEAQAHALVDKFADDLERCASALDARGELVAGAARVVAVADPGGTPALNVKLAPGEAVAQNALLCLIAPIRSASFPASGKRPGLAIEATWGPGKASTSPKP